MQTQHVITVLVTCALGSACANRPPATAPGTGTLTVGVVTSGPNIQALSFRVLIDSNSIGTIDADAGVLSTSIPTGAHQISLGGLPGRCSVQGDAERPIKILEDRVTAVRFSVVCK